VLEPCPRSALGCTERRRAAGEIRSAPLEIRTLRVEFGLTRIETLELPVERIGSFLDPALGALGLFTPAILFLFPRFPKSESFFFSGELPGFASVVCFFFGPLEDAGGLVLSFCLL